MADKTTTLKTKTNDNVYPNVIGDNRKNAFVDSSTITHHFYDKTHKVGFQIANETNIKIQNSLQKPSVLTKTELVGVGTNGQENIEIGDNLTLANGKLSATGGAAFDIITSIDGVNYTGTISGTKPVLLSMTNTAYLSNSYSNGEAVFSFTGIGNKYQFRATNGKIKIDPSDLQKKLFLHFITLTSNTSTFYFTLPYTSKDKLNTLDLIKIVLAGKYLLCTGHTDTEKAEYISVERGNIVVGVVDNSDNSTSGITIDSSFIISDDVSPVE